MATSLPPEAFVWGAGGAKLSPAEVARQREIAAALMEGGMDYSPVGHWMQGAARAAQGLVGGLKDRWANEAAQSGREGFQTQLSSIFGGGSPAATASPIAETASVNPVAEALMSPAPTTATAAAANVASTPPTQSVIGGNKQSFIDALMPAAIEASARTGVDPRIIVAQAAQETGWGKSAPNNNYFGIKSHGKSGGGTFSTTEYVNGKPVTIQDSFRGYESPADSVAGYADFLLENPRYKPMMGAQGLDAQLEQLGLSGYATDPSYASSVGSIARSLQLPEMGGAPAAAAPSQPSVAELLSLSGNEWATPAQSSVLNALIGQQLGQQDPMYQLQRQKAELELQQMLNPSAPKPVFEGGQWWDISSGMPNALTEAAASTGFDTITLDVPGVGPQTFNTADPQQRQAANQLLGQGATEVRAPGVNVSVGGSAPAPAQGYQNIFDENGRLVRQEMVEGGAPWMEAQAAAEAAKAQEGAQLASDIETAEKTLTSTKNVLDILDNSGGQPTTGTLSIPFAALSGTPAGRIRSYVSTLQSGVALGAMQRLKEASATGATGFGALSAPELNLLISDIGALDPNNAEPDIFRETIQRIDGRTKRVVADIRKNVSPERIEELGLREFLDAVDPEGAKPSVDPNDIDALLELYK